MTAGEVLAPSPAAGTAARGESRRLVAQVSGKYVGLYKNLHSLPEPSGKEFRTARTVAARLRNLGLRVHERVGGSGVVGILQNGPGPTVVLGAELDALPCKEATNLPYASTQSGSAVGDGGVMHACGHDAHMAALLGATEVLGRLRTTWSGTLVVLFQPEEETGRGALSMIHAGVLDLFPAPTVFLAQHVSPMPAGSITLKPGPTTSAGNGLRVTLHGIGGHAAFPEHGLNPLSTAARLVLSPEKLSQRHVGTSIVNIGAAHAGTVDNRIPDSAELHLSIRSRSAAAQQVVLGEVRAAVSLATQGQRSLPAEVVETAVFPMLENSPGSTSRLYEAFYRAGLPVFQLEEASWASDDFGAFGTAAQCPSVYWFWGASDPALFSSHDLELLRTGSLPANVPVNHSTRFAPEPVLTVSSGITNLVTAALDWTSG
ncbi:amidohydrolase [uncultured Arthrobacter sp.]|uniref:amidohydrolase n=1 Tax=uncultured Arthrobacter sp. TaxID=114050 RepID=UPI002634A2B3|nr:amidohydrolase [uncultured Arthrobacter sp.]